MQRRKTNFLNGTKENSVNKNNDLINLDTQVKAVKPKVYRRKFSNSDKLKILQAYDSCNDVAERGALLRKEGLYYASITKWRQQLSENNSKRVNSKGHKFSLLHNQVLRENTTLKKKLAQAEAIIDLQKKVSELLSAHVLKPEMSEE
jgi:transposase-like protein